MVRTITLGSCVAIQGKFERQLEDGRVAVRVGDEVFVGKPVEKQAVAPHTKEVNAS